MDNADLTSALEKEVLDDLKEASAQIKEQFKKYESFTKSNKHIEVWNIPLSSLKKKNKVVQFCNYYAIQEN